MKQKSFERFIENILKNENFDVPTASTFYNFNDLGENWCKDWTTLFKKILKDIKAGVNYCPDEDNQEGHCVTDGPLSNRKEWLSVYFQLQKNGKHTIYMIKLEAPADVSSHNYSSLKKSK